MCVRVQDGVIHDMQNTIDLIVEASNMPLSIVIVGVGGADFHNMVGSTPCHMLLANCRFMSMSCRTCWMLMTRH